MQTALRITVITLVNLQVGEVLDQKVIKEGDAELTIDAVLAGWEELGYDPNDSDYVVEQHTHTINL